MAKDFPVLDGKTAIITGAAMGMGEATARVFAQAKANVSDSAQVKIWSNRPSTSSDR